MNDFHTIKTADEVPGWTSTQQHNKYKDIAEHLPKNPRVLEIGCGWGRSTWAWLDALPATTDYYILDNFSLQLGNTLRKKNWLKKWPHINEKARKTKNLTQRKIFDGLISQHPNKDIIKTIWHMNGEDWLQSNHFTNNFDLVYLDDDHSFNAVSTWLNTFKNVPIVCGDDYNVKCFPQVIEAVNNYTIENEKYLLVPISCFYVIKNS